MPFGGQGTDLTRGHCLTWFTFAGQSFRHTAVVRALLMRVISPEATGLCRCYGFTSSPVDPMPLPVTLADARHNLGGWSTNE